MRLIILFLLFSIVINGCKVEEPDPFEVINESFYKYLTENKEVLLFVEDDEISFRFLDNQCVVWDILNIYKGKISDDIELLSEEEVQESICKQLESNLKIDSKRLSGKLKLIDNDYLEKQGYGGAFTTYHVVSNPAFFLNGKYAIIYKAVHCGMECGDGNIEVYEAKDDGSWSLVFSHLLWIS
ncbi:hypothetical protein [Pararhodonellum marinum]|uniref:hypothetical protein n=1 Tax=Pararhodonellum marinum TaxID=2755358 RepID=UPI00188FA4CA|nr:hypothetical protein [Pararhodonellum marinum]